MAVRTFTELEKRDLNRLFKKWIFEGGYDSVLDPPLVDILDAAATDALTAPSFIVVADRAARDALPLRKLYMLVSVQAEGGAMYTLRSGTTNADWRPVASPRAQYIGPGALQRIYVAPAGGDDITGDGSLLAPYATAARAGMDLPDLIERDIEIVLRAGTHGVDGFDGPGVHFHAGRFHFAGVQVSTGARGSIRIRGEPGSLDVSVTTVSATVVTGEEVVTEINIGTPIVHQAGNTFVEWDFFGVLYYFPVISVVGNNIRVVTDPNFFNPGGGDQIRVMSFGTTVLSLDVIAPRTGYLGNGFIVSALRLGAGFHTVLGTTLTGIAHDDGQATLRNCALSGAHINAAGFPGSTAANAVVEDSSLDTLNFTSTGEFQLSGVISPFMLIRHRNAIDHKFFIRSAEVQEITDYPSSFDGAGIVFDQEYSFFEARGKYNIGNAQTTLHRLLQTLVRGNAGAPHTGTLTGPIITLHRGGSVKGISTLLNGLAGANDVRDEGGTNYARGAAPVGILNLLAGFST